MQISANYRYTSLASGVKPQQAASAERVINPLPAKETIVNKRANAASEQQSNAGSMSANKQARIKQFDDFTENFSSAQARVNSSQQKAISNYQQIAQYEQSQQLTSLLGIDEFA